MINPGVSNIILIIVLTLFYGWLIFVSTLYANYFSLFGDRKHDDR